jgi:predicted extracellular nuclease
MTNHAESAVQFSVGSKVHKIGGDYTFEGVVVAVFAKLSGAIRYVVEDDRGVLHVYSEKNLRRS